MTKRKVSFALKFTWRNLTEELVLGNQSWLSTMVLITPWARLFVFSSSLRLRYLKMLCQDALHVNEPYAGSLQCCQGVAKTCSRQKVFAHYAHICAKEKTLSFIGQFKIWKVKITLIFCHGSFFLTYYLSEHGLTNNYFIGIFFYSSKGSNNIKYMFSIMDFPSEKI